MPFKFANLRLRINTKSGNTFRIKAISFDFYFLAIRIYFTQDAQIIYFSFQTFRSAMHEQNVDTASFEGHHVIFKTFLYLTVSISHFL